MTTWDRASIENIARLMAALDDPSADKGAILASAGFERTEAWEYLQQAWLDRLVAEPKGQLARAFAAAYSAAAGCALGDITLTPTAEMTLAPVSARAS